MTLSARLPLATWSHPVSNKTRILYKESILNSLKKKKKSLATMIHSQRTSGIQNFAAAKGGGGI